MPNSCKRINKIEPFLPIVYTPLLTTLNDNFIIYYSILLLYSDVYSWGNNNYVGIFHFVLRKKLLNNFFYIFENERMKKQFQGLYYNNHSIISIVVTKKNHLTFFCIYLIQKKINSVVDVNYNRKLHLELFYAIPKRLIKL